MTGWRKRQVLEMAREAGIIHPENVSKVLEAFAKLVRKDEHDQWVERAADLIRLEREACAMVCEEEQGYKTAFCALKIRARGQA